MSFVCDICKTDATRLKFKEIDGEAVRVCPDCKQWKGRVPVDEEETKKGLIR